MWLDLADPVQTQERFTAADPEREALGAMLRALYQLQESKWFKAKDISLAVDDALLDALALADVTPENQGHRAIPRRQGRQDGRRPAPHRRHRYAYQGAHVPSYGCKPLVRGYAGICGEVFY